MADPEKPFACTMPECGMTFTNVDHLNVHMKKHDMVLQLGSEQKASFVADQTPTPTRFIRNCEEVGLFQDLQNVNPFDEGFKRAMETKHGILSLENALSTPSSSDDLHTPQMVFPLVDGDAALYSSSNNQRNITISRSSSDESGAIKEFEKTTISKLTNEVTISRIVGKTDEKQDEKDIRTDSVSYTNNVIKISNIRKDSIDKNPVQTVIYEDTVITDSSITKDIKEKKNTEVPPIMSQKSLDFIVDSLNNEYDEASKKKNKINDDEFEVIIKLPTGKQVRMKAVDESTDKTNAKEILKKTLSDKVDSKIKQLKNNVKNNDINTNNVPGNNVNKINNVNLTVTGTLIPVTIVPSVVPKVPIIPFKFPKVESHIGKRKIVTNVEVKKEMGVQEEGSKAKNKRSDINRDLESKCAASRRYRARLKETFQRNAQENMRLRESNQKLEAECALLKNIILKHATKCPDAQELKTWLEKFK